MAKTWSWTNSSLHEATRDGRKGSRIDVCSQHEPSRFWYWVIGISEFSDMIQGEPISNKGTIMADIATNRMELDQCRLLTMEAARLMDTVGNKGARKEIAMIKVCIEFSTC